MQIGIDLGTTFCCVAFIDDGIAKPIPDSKGRILTPSVVWFDGNTAYVGEEGNKKKVSPFSPVYEFFKRDMGKPTEETPGRTDIAAYEIRGTKYGAAGISAILLRKLKKDVWQYFRKQKLIDETIKEKDFKIDTIITIPAYFGEDERQATKCAGHLAGLNVTGIINEPTAASLTYGITLNGTKKIMVFDLGGGTFDVSIVDVVNGNINAKASEGNNQLGGKEWDELIEDYIRKEFYRITQTEISIERLWNIQEMAIQAKKELSENQETTVYISENEFDVELKLYRKNPNKGNFIFLDDINLDAAMPFYFEERASDLLSKCESRCMLALKQFNLSWSDIDEIVLAGGSCRMPMIPEMLERISGKQITRHREGFSYDTAIALGAAIYGQSRGKIVDITPKTVGVKIFNNNTGLEEIDHLIYKNSPLPAKAKRKYHTDPYATLEVYEGESKNPEIGSGSSLIGTLELQNSSKDAIVMLEVTEEGILRVMVDQPEGVKETKITGGNGCSEQLKEKIQAISIIS